MNSLCFQHNIHHTHYYEIKNLVQFCCKTLGFELLSIDNYNNVNIIDNKLSSINDNNASIIDFNYDYSNQFKKN